MFKAQLRAILWSRARRRPFHLKVFGPQGLPLRRSVLTVGRDVTLSRRVSDNAPFAHRAAISCFTLASPDKEIGPSVTDVSVCAPWHGEHACDPRGVCCCCCCAPEVQYKDADLQAQAVKSQSRWKETNSSKSFQLNKSRAAREQSLLTSKMEGFVGPYEPAEPGGRGWCSLCARVNCPECE